MVKCSSSSCQHATRAGCVCACKQGNHGAQARIRWAQALAKEASQRNQQEKEDVNKARTQQGKAEKAIIRQSKKLRKSIKSPRRPDANTFFESIRSIEIVSWLIEHPTECEQMKWIASQVGEAAEELLLQTTGRQQHIADHLWCDILAALATVLAETLKSTDQLISTVSAEIAEQVWKLVKATREEELGNAPCQTPKTRNKTSRLTRDQNNGIDELILKKVTEELIKKIIHTAFSEPRTSIESLLLQVRLLTLLFCPDVYAHRAVWNNCLVPLIKAEIIALSSDELKQMRPLFEEKWHWEL